MTREEIDAILRSIDERAQALRAQPDRHTVTDFDVLLLARVVADQEARLRALEPCPSGRFEGGPHEWSGLGGNRCAYCPARKPTP